MTDSANKTVLITGASGGFGRHMVRQFGAAGAKLVLTDLTDDALRSAADEAGDALVARVVADLSTDDGCEAVIGLCATEHIVPDILINNAGIALAGRLDHVPRDRWETLIQLNLLTPMRLCNHFVPAMVERGSGHIVNISSLAGWVGARGMASYCASKFGLRGYGESQPIASNETAAGQAALTDWQLDEQAAAVGFGVRSRFLTPSVAGGGSGERAEISA